MILVITIDVSVTESDFLSEILYYMVIHGVTEWEEEAASICHTILLVNDLGILHLLVTEKSVNYTYTVQCYASVVYAVIVCPSVCLSIKSWYCIEMAR